MIRDPTLPSDIATRLATLGQALERCPAVVFAYLFGSAASGHLGPLSDVDVAIYLEDARDPKRSEQSRRTSEQTRWTWWSSKAPTALAGRILGSRRVILDRAPFRRHCFESLALRKFLDFRIFEHRLLAERYPGG